MVLTAVSEGVALITVNLGDYVGFFEVLVCTVDFNIKSVTVIVANVGNYCIILNSLGFTVKLKRITRTAVYSVLNVFFFRCDCSVNLCHNRIVCHDFIENFLTFRLSITL